MTLRLNAQQGRGPPFKRDVLALTADKTKRQKIKGAVSKYETEVSLHTSSSETSEDGPTSQMNWL